ncbi:MAG: hypothetical protein ABI042_10355 [Verrucomicrobiota bacterium]
MKNEIVGNAPFIQFNLILAWLGILLGFGSGFLLGLGFDKEKWLGSYTSWKRRLYRLGHISFFGLALMNLAFYFTAKNFSRASSGAAIASLGFAIGAISMPVCCLLMAHKPKWRAVFLVPVLSLITAATFTLLEIIKL